jgi:hypothetical protein
MAPKPIQQTAMTGFSDNLNQNFQAQASYLYPYNSTNEIPRNYNGNSENKVNFNTCL